jgi:hypothetical protein
MRRRRRQFPKPLPIIRRGFFVINHSWLKEFGMRLQTKTIHTGVDKDSAYNSIMTPIYQTCPSSIFHPTENGHQPFC